VERSRRCRGEQEQKRGRRKRIGPSVSFAIHESRQNMRGTKTTVWEKVRKGDVGDEEGDGAKKTRTPAKCWRNKRKDVKRDKESSIRPRKVQPLQDQDLKLDYSLVDRLAIFELELEPVLEPEPPEPELEPAPAHGLEQLLQLVRVPWPW